MIAEVSMDANPSTSQPSWFQPYAEAARVAWTDWAAITASLTETIATVLEPTLRALEERHDTVAAKAEQWTREKVAQAESELAPRERELAELDQQATASLQRVGEAQVKVDTAGNVADQRRDIAMLRAEIGKLESVASAMQKVADQYRVVHVDMQAAVDALSPVWQRFEGYRHASFRFALKRRGWAVARVIARIGLLVATFIAALSVEPYAPSLEAMLRSSFRDNAQVGAVFLLFLLQTLALERPIAAAGAWFERRAFHRLLDHTATMCQTVHEAESAIAALEQHLVREAAAP